MSVSVVPLQQDCGCDSGCFRLGLLVGNTSGLEIGKGLVGGLFGPVAMLCKRQGSS